MSYESLHDKLVGHNIRPISVFDDMESPDAVDFLRAKARQFCDYHFIFIPGDVIPEANDYFEGFEISDKQVLYCFKRRDNDAYEFANFLTSGPDIRELIL